MADEIKRELNVDVELVAGGGGIFEVRVNGAVVAKKTPDGFPDEHACVTAVRQAL